MVSHSLDVLTKITVPVPESVIRRVLEHGADGPEAPVVPRPSASVILIREGGGSGLEVYLMHRHPAMVFAGSMAVFPGGGVDPVDHESADPVLACAVRELAEETGVRIASEALLPWAHWITPEIEPRRYDTRFFVAVLPDDQEAADISGEATSADWAEPRATLEAHRRGELGLMPPTFSILTELAELGSVPAVLNAAQDRVVETVLPVPERVGDRWRFRYPRRGSE